ncbi:hypothetical protein SAMN05192552_10951, partial [Natrinema hispanicum]
PADSNRNERWWTANRNIPTLGFLRLQAEEDVNSSIVYEALNLCLTA